MKENGRKRGVDERRTGKKKMDENGKMEAEEWTRMRRWKLRSG